MTYQNKIKKIFLKIPNRSTANNEIEAVILKVSSKEKLRTGWIHCWTL
jgi:hypothetical protein